MKRLFQYIIAIDPGTKMSGVCLMRCEDYKPLWVAKVENEKVLEKTLQAMYDNDPVSDYTAYRLVIERMHNPMSADSNVFLTCEWIGRFDVLFNNILKIPTSYLFRHEEYKNLCANLYSRNDKGIRSALVDRFAYGIPNYGKGNKAQPGWFYGFSADTWSAYAIAVTEMDKRGDLL